MGDNKVLAVDAEPAGLDVRALRHLPLLVEALDAQGRVVFWNDECARVSGYASEDALADPEFLRRLYPGPGRMERVLESLAQRGPAFRGAEQTLRTRSGGLVTIAWTAIPPPAAVPNAQWYVGIDVTEARAAREALRTSEAGYRQLVESGRDLIALHDPDGRFRFISPAVTEMLGYAPEELLGSNPYDLYHPDDALNTQREAHERILAGTAHTTSSYRFRRKNGSYAWLETLGAPLFEDSHDRQRVTAIMTSTRDVSDKLDAARRLATSEERLRQALLATGIGIFDIRLPAYSGFVSNALLRLYGYGPTHRDRFERGWLPLVHPDDSAAFIDQKERVDRGVADQLVYEVRRMHRDGRYIWVRTVGRIIERDAVGRGLRLIGAVQDVDTRKREEQALLNSRARLSEAQAIARLGDWRSHGDDPRERWSEEYYRVIGLSPETCVPSLEAFLAAVHPEDLDAVRRHVADADLAGGDYDCRIVWPDGSVRHVHCQTRVSRDPMGRRLGLAGTMQDVTERKGSEAALRAAADDLARAQRLARLGSWRWSVDGDAPTWTPEVFRIFGLDPAGPAVPYAECAPLYAPESWRRLNAVVERAIQDSTPFELEVELVRPRGRRGWAMARGEPSHDHGGRVVGLFGTMQDITERKEVEIALREARDRVRALSSHLEDELNQERKRIALDVHDELGQMLTAMRLQLDLLQSQRGDRAALDQAAGRLREMIENTIEVTRNVAMNLRPPALDLGLVPALEWLAEDFALRSEVACSVRAEPGERVLDDKQATELFRIAQESLTNVARHAGAGEVKIWFGQTAKDLTMDIQDDGRGFDPAAVPANAHFGLLGMRERALRLGAELQIESHPGQGTRVRVRLPGLAGANR